MKSIILIVSTLFLVTLSAFPFVGQDRKLTIRTPYTTESINPSFNQLPRNFTGHDLRAIQHLLSAKSVQFTKKEFETTKQFEERLKTETQKQLIGTLTLNDKFIFSFIPANLEYTADKQQFSVEFNGYREQIIWKTQKIGERRYVGQNAFNVKKLVTETTFHSWHLIVNENDQEACILNPLLAYASKQCFQRSLMLSATTSQAIKIKNDIRLFVYGQIVFPYISSKTSQTEASVTSPYAKSETMYYVHFRPHSSGLYNLKSGELLSRRDFSYQ